MLQLDFLSEGSADCPLLRIWGNDLAAVVGLKNAFEQLSRDDLESVVIDEIPGIVPHYNCRLTAVVGKWDRGVVRHQQTNSFDWVLKSGTWDNVVALIEPFCEVSFDGGFQWLESAGDIRVLITRTGKW